jgi:flagellar biosynthesis protein FlhF
MTTKSFQAETMIEALQMVQQEMGPDAVVISARDIPIGSAWQVWKKTGVEVISISPDEIEKVHGRTQKNQQPSRIIRPSRNGAGVEFIEDRPTIEWEGNKLQEAAEPQVPPTLNQSNSGYQPQETHPVIDAKTLWKPRYLSKEDIQSSNQLLTNHSQITETLEKKQITVEQPIKVIDQPSGYQTGDNCPMVLQRFIDKLKGQGVEKEFTDRLVKVTLKGCSPALLENETKVREFLANYLSANLSVRSWSTADPPGKILVFVGLSGCGKTNSLAKVAIFYNSLLGKKVVWVCADTVRTSGIAEAKTYSEAVGIPLELAYTPAELRIIVAKHADADLILIDTPGFNPFVEEQEVELGSFLAEMPEAQILLVTSATAKETDSMRCYESLKYFGLKGSVISKLDETRSYGSIFNFSRKSHLPLTFFTSSRKASVGLKIASADLLVEALFRERW